MGIFVTSMADERAILKPLTVDVCLEIKFEETENRGFSPFVVAASLLNFILEQEDEDDEDDEDDDKEKSLGPGYRLP